MSSKYSAINNLTNPFTCLLTIIFLGCLFCSGYYSLNRFYEIIGCSIPLFFLFNLWSIKTWPLLQKTDKNISKNDMFKIDLFLLAYSFYFSGLLVIVFNYNNADVQGWWVMGVFLTSVIGFIFALIYSLFGLLINPHRLYSFIYCAIFFLILVYLNVFPTDVTMGNLGTFDIFWLIYCVAILIHIAIIIIFLIAERFSSKKIN